MLMANIRTLHRSALHAVHPVGAEHTLPGVALLASVQLALRLPVAAQRIACFPDLNRGPDLRHPSGLVQAAKGSLAMEG